MKGSNLGEFEELVMLAAGSTFPDAYGVSIKEKIAEITGRKPTLSAVHGALNRLEEKGFLSSNFGDPTPERGGKKKRLFYLTAVGSRALHDVRDQREAFWKSIQNPALKGKLI